MIMQYSITRYTVYLVTYCDAYIWNITGIMQEISVRQKILLTVILQSAWHKSSFSLSKTTLTQLQRSEETAFCDKFVQNCDISAVTTECFCTKVENWSHCETRLQVDKGTV